MSFSIIQSIRNSKRPWLTISEKTCPLDWKIPTENPANMEISAVMSRPTTCAAMLGPLWAMMHKSQQELCSWREIHQRLKGIPEWGALVLVISGPLIVNPTEATEDSTGGRRETAYGSLRGDPVPPDASESLREIYFNKRCQSLVYYNSEKARGTRHNQYPYYES